jgi:hypothetical protein
MHYMQTAQKCTTEACSHNGTLEAGVASSLVAQLQPAVARSELARGCHAGGIVAPLSSAAAALADQGQLHQL